MDIKGILLFVILFSLFGCSTIGQTLKIDYNNRQEYVNNHPDLSSEIKNAIFEGKVIKGMTQSDVLAVWGRPSRTYSEISGESWFYDQPFFSLYPWKSVSFTSEGKVYNFGKGWGG